MTTSSGPGVPTIAAIIPTVLRSRAELDRAVRSVLAQTVPVAEVCVVVDVLAQDLPSWDDPRVHVVVNPGEHGPGAARAFALQSSQSDLVAWLDDDDEWTPRRLEKQLAALGERRDVVVAGRSQLDRPTGSLLVPDRPPQPGEDFRDYLFPSPGRLSSPVRSLCTPSLLVPRAVLDRHPIRTDTRRWEDYGWLLEVIDGGVGLLVVPEVCCVVDQGRASGTSASEVSLPDADLAWAERHLGDPPSKARDVFVLTHVVPALAKAGRAAEARRELCGAVARRPAPSLVVKSLVLSSGDRIAALGTARRAVARAVRRVGHNSERS